MRYRTAVLAFLVVALFGCKRIASLAATLKDKAEAAGDAVAKEGRAGDEDALLNGLVDCVNGVDASIGKSLERYAGWLPAAAPGAPQPGPTGNERVVYGLFSVQEHHVTSCKKGLAGARDHATFGDVVSKFEATTDKIVPVINDAHTYYDRKDYKDDGFAKAKEIHTKLWPLAEEFFQVSREFRTAVATANDARMDAEVKEVEAKYGRNLLFQKLHVMRQAKAVVVVASDEDGALAAIEPLLSAYEASVDDMLQYARSNKSEVDKVLLWSSFEREAENYLKALKVRARRLRENKGYSEFELKQLESGSGWMVEGSSVSVNQAYNTLVNKSNSLQFRY